jgi:prepilin-type N-terminal cleavage/methylation domain-containing protein
MSKYTVQQRSGVTLLEVLITIFIMGIGMLALLALFPLGAINMGRALRDDRATTSVIMADNVATIHDIRHLPGVIPPVPPPGTDYFTAEQPPQVPALPPTWAGRSHPVYLDPFYALLSAPPVGASTGQTPGIPRINLNLAANTILANRWFSLPDDISFNDDGTPEIFGANVNRGGDYTWAYLLRRPNASNPDVVDMKVVVYYRRPTDLIEGEAIYDLNLRRAPGQDDQVILSWNPATQEKPGVRLGRWILDTSLVSTVDPVTNQTRPTTAAEFYRIVNYEEITGSNQFYLELQPPLQGNNSARTAVFMEYVVEVFDKGTGR